MWLFKRSGSNVTELDSEAPRWAEAAEGFENIKHVLDIQQQIIAGGEKDSEETFSPLI